MKPEDLLVKFKRNEFSVWRWFIFICPVLVASSALFIMTGWITHNARLIQIIPDFPPMQFNTALAFFISSVVFLLGLLRVGNFIRIFSLLILVTIASSTLIEYILNTNYGIDTFFVKPFITIRATYPGRMAPTSAIAFILISISLFLISPHTRLTRSRALTIGFFISICFAIGVVPILGYLASIETAYTLGTFVRIPIETAINFILLSLAIIGHVWNRSEKDALWLPIPVFIGFLTVSLSMATALYNQEVINFNQTLRANTQNAAILTQQALENLAQALNRMIIRREATAGQNQSAVWRADAQAHLHDFHYLLALSALNEELRTESIEPAATYSSLINPDDALQKTLIQKAIAARAPTVSNLITFSQGDRGFLCFFPVFINNQFSGMLVVAISSEKFFNSIFTKERFSTDYISIFNNGQLLYTNNPQPQNNSTMQEQNKSSVNYKNIHWVIQLVPTPDTLEQRVSPTYMVVMGFGILMSFLVTLCVYLVLNTFEKTLALKESESRYRTILDGVKDYAVCMLTPEGLVRSWNYAAEQIFGYTEAEILGSNFSLFYTSEDYRRHAPKRALNVAKKRGRHEENNERVRKDGSQFWAQIIIIPLYGIKQKLAGFVAITRDVTDSRKMLQERANLFALIEESSDFVGIADLDGHLQYHNLSARRMVGLPDDFDITQLRIADMHPSWVMKKLSEEVLPIVHEKGAWVGETALLHRNGHEIPVLQSINLHRDATGKAICLTTIMRDITERKEHDEANKKLMAQLAASNAELERFAYVASHDLQEPVRMINSFGEMLLREKQNQLDDEAKDYLTIMTDAGIRMRDVINDLLAYSRVGRETIQFIPFDGEEILNGALNNLHALIEEQHAQIIHDPLPTLYGNPMQIMRLLQNLITNAIKYQSPQRAPVININVSDEGANWLISVKDNGIGIEEQFINEIFEPFRRLHTWEAINGTGLGLSICRKIAELHRGTLTATSVLGEGSVFWLIIPKYVEGDRHES